MTVFESLTIMISFACLVVAILSFHKKTKTALEFSRLWRF